ncbi:MAG: LysR family transcriptional regulator [Pseudomonadota bacterium]
MVQNRSTYASWDGLEAILLVGRHGTVRAAAEAVGVAHTTLARRIAAAERELGITAFVKSVKGYVPTEEGEIVIERAGKMAFEASVMAKSLDTADQPLAGSVRVSLSSTILTHIVAPMLSEFHTRYPGIELVFDIADTLVDLDRRDADVVLRMQQAPAPDLVGRRIGQVHVAAYQHIGSEHDRSVNQDCVPVIGWGDPRQVHQAFSRLGIENFQIVASTPDIAAQVALSAAYKAVLELPCYVGDTLKQLRRVSDVAYGFSELWCLTHTSLRASRRVRAVTDFLSEGLSVHRGLIEGGGRDAAKTELA